MITMLPDKRAKQVFRDNLHRLLEKRGLTIYRLASDAQLPQRRVYRAATGESLPDANLAIAIAKFLKVSVEQLFFEKAIDESVKGR